MPPKDKKGKNVAPVVPTFAFTARAAKPEAIPVPAFQRPSSIVALRSHKRQGSVLLSVDPEGRLRCTHHVATETGGPGDILSVASVEDAHGRVIDVSSKDTVNWMTGNGKGCAMVMLRSLGLCVLGDLDESHHDVSEGTIQLVRLDTYLAKKARAPGVFTSLPEGTTISAAAIGDSHFLLLVLQQSTGTTEVYGFGWAGYGALGGPSKTNSSSQALWSNGSLPLTRVEGLGAETITRVMASGHLSVVGGKAGTFVFGKLSETISFGSPQLVLQAADGFVEQAGTTNSHLWLLHSDGGVSYLPLNDPAGITRLKKENVPHKIASMACNAVSCALRSASDGTVVSIDSELNVVPRKLPLDPNPPPPPEPPAAPPVATPPSATPAEGESPAEAPLPVRQRTPTPPPPPTLFKWNDVGSVWAAGTELFGYLNDDVAVVAFE